MGLSAWNAYRARQAELQKTLTLSKNEPEKENFSTSPAKSGVEVEKQPEKVIEEEVKPKKKRK